MAHDLQSTPRVNPQSGPPDPEATLHCHGGSVNPGLMSDEPCFPQTGNTKMRGLWAAVHTCPHRGPGSNGQRFWLVPLDESCPSNCGGSSMEYIIWISLGLCGSS